ncbi:MAM domain-containing glycosylphosphatidylinositol anchor protein 1-like [Mytilus edulis]|uniref:MAM domain-containing glycosylphosphatidylinositol anchor protein 1-like n=1 Tax=Mytilus edulis TaxID=6550 RepID=UPI0039F0B10F
MVCYTCYTTVIQGETWSTDTGPGVAAEGTYYLYIEVSDQANGDKAILTTTEATNLQACPYCLSFKYHMLEVDIGSLEVFAGDKTSSLTSIWRKEGPQSRNPVDWDNITIDIPQSSNLGVTIVGYFGIGYKGDIGIDDILLNAGACRISYQSVTLLLPS